MPSPSSRVDCGVAGAHPGHCDDDDDHHGDDDDLLSGVISGERAAWLVLSISVIYTNTNFIAELVLGASFKFQDFFQDQFSRANNQS